MSWSAKAEVFRRCFGRTGDVTIALQEVDRVFRPRLTAAQVSQVRARWAAGEKPAAIAAEFGISDSAVRQRCRGIPRPSRPDVGHHVPQVCALVAAELGLDADWAEQGRGSRARRPRKLTIARRAAALALCQLGMCRNEIGRQLFGYRAAVYEDLRRAERDIEVQHLALTVLVRIEGEQARGQAAAEARAA